MIELRLRDHGLVRSKEVFSPFWIDWVRFDVLGQVEDVNEILEELVTHVQYGFSYLGPREVHDSFEDAHGPYVLSAMSTRLFEPVAPATAKMDLSEWLIERSEPHWSFRSLGLSLIADLPDRGSAFRLPDLEGSIPVTELGWIVGSQGFDEWIFIDETRETLTLVVATDD